MTLRLVIWAGCAVAAVAVPLACSSSGDGAPSCDDVTCDSPPARTCADANTLVSFDPAGTCTDGRCSYAEQTFSCSQGCQNAACIGEPCVGIICSTPPASECADANTLKTYATPGTCQDGSCSYDSSTAPCSEGCAAGRCTGGSDRFVRAGASGDGSQGNPYGSIQQAIDAAGDSDRILVAKGEYRENLEVQGKTVELLGGFSADFSAPAPRSNVTTIRGSADASVISLISAGATRVEGFTITGGKGNFIDGTFVKGGGVYIEGGSPTIKGNIISGNDTRRMGDDVAIGGGVYAKSSNVRVEGNTVRDNLSGQGAGITVEGGTSKVIGNTVDNNIGHSDHGGGIYVSGQVEVASNTVTGNEIGKSVGYGWGGGIYVFNVGTVGNVHDNVVRDNFAPTIGSGEFIDDGATATIRNDLIISNRCPSEGGAAIYVDGADATTPSHATFINITVAGHKCNPGVGGNVLLIDQGSTATFKSSIFWGNDGANEIEKCNGCSVKISYSSTKDSASGIGNRTGDPQFVGGSDYHLKPSSPCIDKGDPGGDFSREPQPNGGRINMGAYGGTAQATKS